MNEEKVAALRPAAPAGETRTFSVIDPYAAVDWDAWGAYRAQLHAHTLYSDGHLNIADVVEAYYAQGYDILAVTDHGVVHTGWNRPHKMIPLVGYNRLIKRKEIFPLGDARCAEIAAGTDRGGRGMLDVKQGIEMNAATLRKNHVNGFFCGWGQNRLGREEDYETAVAATERAGGISFINHPGDFIHASKNPARAADFAALRVFTDVLLAHPGCVGVEAFNRIDRVTRYDRVLWDHLLMYCIPRGRNVFAFASDDSHVPTDIGMTAEIVLLPELSEKALRTAMETGAFFACARIAREELGEDFKGSGDYARVTRIAVDDENDVITVTAENADEIEWLSDGRVIAAGGTLRLREHADDIGSYVRFQIKNGGGLLLSQAFICDDGHMERRLVPAPEPPRYGFFAGKAHALGARLRKTLPGELVYIKYFMDK